MTPRLAGGLVASHAAVFLATAVLVRELTIHLRFCPNPTGFWWAK